MLNFTAIDLTTVQDIQDYASLISGTHCENVYFKLWYVTQSCPWVGSTRGLGWPRVGSRFCSFRWVGLARVKYDKSTIFSDDYTTYICIPVELPEQQ